MERHKVGRRISSTSDKMSEWWDEDYWEWMRYRKVLVYEMRWRLKDQEHSENQEWFSQNEDCDEGSWRSICWHSSNWWRRPSVVILWCPYSQMESLRIEMSGDEMEREILGFSQISWEKNETNSREIQEVESIDSTICDLMWGTWEVEEFPDFFSSEWVDRWWYYF